MKETKVWLGIMILVVSSAIFANNANATSKNNLLTKSVEMTTAAQKAALVVSKAKKLESYENMTHLTDVQLKELLSLVGFKGRDLVVAWAVAKKESNGRPLAFNGNHKTGDSSYGMFQINMIDGLGPDRREKFDLDHNADLFNPVKNAEIAYYMSKGGDDWSSWKGITPKTRMWMEKFPN
jgi:hypothetical protein